MNEMTLKKAIRNMPFSFPLAEGTAIAVNASDEKLRVRCCYLTVWKKSDEESIEIFIRPDATFVVTSTNYTFSTFDMKVVRHILNESVPYDKLKQYIGEENVKLIDDRILYYVLKSPL